MLRANSKNSRANKSQADDGCVRIIAGKWRGRKLPVKNVTGLRPTTDRIKETLFNWLQAELYHAKCLDLFAGSGSLGFEALSRQALQVTFIEKDSLAHRQLDENIQQLQADNAKLYQADALSFLDGKPSGEQVFDLVFIDPPFRQQLLEQACDKLDKNQWIKNGSLIYVETESELNNIQLPTSWQLLKEKTAGQVCFRLYKKEEK